MNDEKMMPTKPYQATISDLIRILQEIKIDAMTLKIESNMTMDAISKSIKTIDASESNLISVAPVLPVRKDLTKTFEEKKMRPFESHTKHIDMNVVDHSVNSVNEINEMIEIKQLKNEVISRNAKISTRDEVQEKETAKNHQLVQSIESLDIKDHYPMIGKDKPNRTTTMMQSDDRFWYAAHQSKNILADWTQHIFDRGRLLDQSKGH